MSVLRTLRLALLVVMRKAEPFIPRDKPRSWVICVGAGLIGLGLCLVVVTFPYFVDNKSIGVAIATVLLYACWLTFALSWLVLKFGLITGRYGSIPDKKYVRTWHKALLWYLPFTLILQILFLVVACSCDWLALSNGEFRPNRAGDCGILSPSSGLPLFNRLTQFFGTLFLLNRLFAGIPTLICYLASVVVLAPILYFLKDKVSPENPQ